MYTVIIITLLLIVMAIPTAFADGSVKIDKYTIYAQVDTDGSMTIQEIMTYNFRGSFNGALRDIDVSGSGGIEDINIYVSAEIAPDTLDTSRLLKFTKVDGANRGDDGVFTIEDQGSIKGLTIFSPSQNERKTFVITYILKDVVTKYEDIAELYWQFIPGGWDFDLENVDVHINIPKGASVEDLKIFGHGPLTGESTRVDGQNLLLTAPKIEPGEFLEARLLFPTDLVPDVRETIREDVKEDIMDEERGWAEEANIERERHRTYYALTNALVILLLVIYIIIFVHVYRKYDKEHRVNKDIRYYRELPGDYSPAVMSVLYSFGSVGTKDITATMMDLVRRGYLKLDTAEIERRVLFVKKKEEDYIFTRTNKQDDGLRPHESYLLDWFIGKIGNGASMSLNALTSYTQSTSGARSFQNNYQAWQTKVRAEAKSEKFFDENLGTGKLIGGTTGVLGIIISIFIMSLGNGLGFISLTSGILMLIYSIAFKRRTPYGAEQYNLWKAFRRFLLEFSNIKEYTPPSIVIWEHYLVYAISLGVAKEVISQLKIVIPPEELTNPSLTYLYTASATRHFMAMDRIENTTRTMERTINTAIASSTESSTMGTGGGFSGGGGGGGGSGGGGGAF